MNVPLIAEKCPKCRMQWKEEWDLTEKMDHLNSCGIENPPPKKRGRKPKQTKLTTDLKIQKEGTRKVNKKQQEVANIAHVHLVLKRCKERIASIDTQKTYPIHISREETLWDLSKCHREGETYKNGTLCRVKSKVTLKDVETSILRIQEEYEKILKHKKEDLELLISRLRKNFDNWRQEAEEEKEKRITHLLSCVEQQPLDDSISDEEEEETCDKEASEASTILDNSFFNTGIVEIDISANSVATLKLNSDDDDDEETIEESADESSLLTEMNLRNLDVHDALPKSQTPTSSEKSSVTVQLPTTGDQQLQTISTPELKRKVKRYGIKAGTRQFMISALQKIMDVKGSLSDSSATECDSSDKESADLALMTDAELETEAEAENGSHEDAILRLIKSADSIYLPLLRFETVTLDQIHRYLKEKGVKIGRKRLLQIMDDNGINILVTKKK